MIPDPMTKKKLIVQPHFTTPSADLPKLFFFVNAIHVENLIDFKSDMTDELKILYPWKFSPADLSNYFPISTFYLLDRKLFPGRLKSINSNF